MHAIVAAWDVLLHLVILIARNRFWVVPIFLILPFFIGGAPHRRRRTLKALMIGFGLGNFFFGPLLSGWLLYRVGQTAAAKVTSTYETLTEINDHDVVGYNVLIRTASGDVIATRFEDDESNVYPPSDFAYPQPDDDFNVRFLPGFPRDFIILTDDDSPWARHQHCSTLSLRLSEAQRRFDFAQGAAAFRAPYVEAIDGYLHRGCAEDGEVAASFLHDRQRALAGNQAD